MEQPSHTSQLTLPSVPPARTRSPFASTKHQSVSSFRLQDRVQPLPLHTEAQGKVKLRLASVLNLALQQMAKVLLDLSAQFQMPVFMASSQEDNHQHYFFLACHSPETLLNKHLLGEKKLTVTWVGRTLSNCHNSLEQWL